VLAALAAGQVSESVGRLICLWTDKLPRDCRDQGDEQLLADLLRLEGSSALQEQWTEQVRARWAARRAYASETGASDGAWVDGDAAASIACDTAMAPVVTGDINVDALEALVRLCVELDAQRRNGSRDASWAAIEQAVIGKTIKFLLHSRCSC
jgi:hypothetical protein